MLILGKKRRLALASQALAASLLIAIGMASPLPAHAQGGLPTLGDGSDLTSSEERRLGDRIIRELYRDPDYIDDPVIGEYVQSIWQPLMATPCCAASATVRRIVSGSPAWKPQAMFAEVTCASTPASSPIVQAPKDSPMSLLRSMRGVMA